MEVNNLRIAEADIYPNNILLVNNDFWIVARVTGEYLDIVNLYSGMYTRITDRCLGVTRIKNCARVASFNASQHNAEMHLRL